MADKKISALTALATIAAGDLLVTVDVSDTTQAASGTTKQITAGQLLSAPSPIGSVTPSSGAFTTINTVVLSGASTPTLAVTGTTTVSGANTGDQTNITGNAATGAVDSVTESVFIAVSGNTATGNVGTVSATSTAAVTGNVATGAVETMPSEVITFQAITRVDGSGAVGTVSNAITIALTGNAAIGSVGIMFGFGWGAIPDSAETYTPISDSAETWVAIVDNSETWTSI